MQTSPKHERPRNATLPVHDRAFLLYGSKRNEVLSLAEIEQYGLDSFGDADYVSLYGMSPREWYDCGIRLMGAPQWSVPLTPSVIVSVATLLQLPHVCQPINLW